MSDIIAWSCGERDRKKCRNAHGCHCREIASLMARNDEAAAEIERLRAQLAAPANAKVREVLEDCRQFMVGQITPVTVGPFVGTISSNHPCHALIAKIDAALARSEEKGHG